MQELRAFEEGEAAALLSPEGAALLAKARALEQQLTSVNTCEAARLETELLAAKTSRKQELLRSVEQQLQHWKQELAK